MTSIRNISTNAAAKAALKQELGVTNLEENQYSGVEVYSTLAELPTTGTLLVSYKVSNDPDTTKNGYYHWTGSIYVKDASLTNGEIESGEVEAVEGGKHYDAYMSQFTAFCREYDSLLIPQGLAKVGDTSPSAVDNYAYLAIESGTIFGITGVVKGDLITCRRGAGVYAIEAIAESNFRHRQLLNTPTSFAAEKMKRFIDEALLDFSVFGGKKDSWYGLATMAFNYSTLFDAAYLQRMYYDADGITVVHENIQLWGNETNPDYPVVYDGIHQIIFYAEGLTVKMVLDFSKIDQGLYQFGANTSDPCRDSYVAPSKNIKNHTSGIVLGTSSSFGNAYYDICPDTDAQLMINEYLVELYNAGGGTLYLTDGFYSLSGAIVMQNNTFLKLSKKAVVALALNANDYIITNHDYINGTSNFGIDGGVFEGYSTGQTRNYTGNPTQTYWGFGFFFKECTGFEIKNCNINNTNAWGIAHFRSEDAIFQHIRFNQNATVGSNGDGITGMSMRNIIIDDISGYTNDDLIVIGASDDFGGSLQGNEIIWDDSGFPSENIRVTNIQSKKHPQSGNWSHRLIGVYTAQGIKINNLYIDGVYGGWQAGSYGIGIINYWPAKGVSLIGDITIRNVSIKGAGSSSTVLQTSTYANMRVDSLTMQNINFDNLSSNQSMVFTVFDSCKCLNIDGVSIENNGANITVNNLLDLRNSDVGVDMSVSVNNVHKNTMLNNVIGLEVGSGSTRINAPAIEAILSRITAPEENDEIVDYTTKHPAIYLGGKWISKITGADL